MPNGGNNSRAELDRESFARAWATGDEYERGRMIFDLNNEGHEAKQMVKRHLCYIYGGLTVVGIGAAAILKSIVGS